MSLPPLPPLPPDRPRATLVRDEDAPTELVGRTTARFVAPGSVTNGEFGLFRWEMPGVAGRAEPHIHRTFSESFYVLEGVVRVYDGGDWRDAHAGDFLYVPRGGVHGFSNESGAPATMLILFSPAPPRERYFRELAELLRSGRQLSDEERAAWLASHDQYMVDA